MSDTLSKIVALVISVFLLFIFPVENLLARQDDITRIIVLNETTEFVDSVRNLGYITPLMYIQFRESLSATGNVYDITMEHIHFSIDPVYTDPVDMTSFQHDYKINRRITYTEEILERLFPGDSMAENNNCRYHLSAGDIFRVKVVNLNKTPSAKVQQMLLMAELPAGRIIVSYGGMVRDENN